MRLSTGSRERAAAIVVNGGAARGGTVFEKRGTCRIEDRLGGGCRSVIVYCCVPGGTVIEDRHTAAFKRARCCIIIDDCVSRSATKELRLATTGKNAISTIVVDRRVIGSCVG